MTELDKTELYLYGTLLALTEEQSVAISKSIKGNLGRFGKSRIVSRGRKIGEIYENVIRHKQTKSSLESKTLESIVSDLEAIMDGSSNLHKTYDQSIWTTLEPYVSGFPRKTESQIETNQSETEVEPNQPKPYAKFSEFDLTKEDIERNEKGETFHEAEIRLSELWARLRNQGTSFFTWQDYPVVYQVIKKRTKYEEIAFILKEGEWIKAKTFKIKNEGIELTQEEFEQKYGVIDNVLPPLPD